MDDPRTSIDITIQYHNILRARAGVAFEMLSVPEGITLRDVLRQVAEAHGVALQEVLFTTEGAVSSHLVVFCNRQLLPATERDVVLTDGDELMLFPAIAGG